MNVCRNILTVVVKNYVVYRNLRRHVVTHISMRKVNSKIIDGKKIADDIQKELKRDIEDWVGKGHRSPCLIAILVGEDPASKKYVHNKMIAAKKVGITSTTINLPENITEEELIGKIQELNEDPSVDGILVQLPVPEHISERKVCNAVGPKKDVDGFHITNMGRLAINMDTLVPCTALAVIELIKRSQIKTFGKNVVVCGRSKHVGLPIALLLHSDARNECPGLEATVTLCHRHTPPEDLEFYLKRADIIISATGVVNLIKPEMVKPGACIIDVGITRIQTESGKDKIVGDVDFEGCFDVAGKITPVPGGVGPMTVVMLMSNTFKSAKLLAV
ncbi:bifunctional methylenetetrahydrofolate dehydrogenase/cyclohydrolase, mitochondrial isoform X1 [Diorhabda carinulata]|uniref:bifunctional methylenetetrahydrofolate dehydrogenase/cyclohydrolase, mitochondrial isoform X1 n=1 Tax=Diorhabda carinulata TaxID=1163345 RepID=UPI0025A056AE|nr:bifunctional methylenetetrahydrofolate dehydrogenase/cyclohydrolase, mitochondrial isoform X1 [Diorhabda carinulata]